MLKQVRTLNKSILVYFFIGASCLTTLPSAAKNINTFIYIPAGSLSDSLREVANAYAVSFSSNPSLINDKTTSTLVGDHTLAQALDFLLRGSELTYKIQDKGFVIFQKKITTNSEILEEITVKGIRYSLASSRNLKHNNKTISEAISAQDITDIPNTNLAEALQYIPGVAITREAGEGRQVSIRGNYPDFSLVTLNGMPVLANNDSPMDSRVQKQRDRSFDFNILPAELFKQIHVIKAYSADKIAGGISGTMALQTINPLDNEGFKFIITPEVGYNDYVGTGAKRYSSLISNTWNNWGVLASVAYTTRESLEQGANTFRWRNIAIDGADLSALTQSQALHLTQGDYIVPRGNRYSVWQATQQRFGANLSVEYKNETTHFDFDMLSGFLKGDRHEYHLYPRGEQSTPIIKGLTTITDIQTNENNELVYARYENARVATESRTQEINTAYQQGVLSLTQQVNTNWKVSAILGKEQSKYDIPYSNKIYTQGISDVTIDYRKTPFYADINYSENLKNPTMWQMHHGDIEQYNSNSEYTFAKLDFQYDINSLITLQFGADWTLFENKMYNAQQNDIFLNELTNTPQQLTDLPASYVSSQHAHKSLQWLKINTNEALKLYGIDPFNIQNNSSSITTEAEHIQEYSRGAYTLISTEQAQWEAHIGLRYQAESITSHTQAPYSPISYSLWLPTFNGSYFINDKWRLRVGLSKNYSKPLLNSLSFNGSNDTPNNTKYTFNSSLKPYLSYNTDISLEADFSSRSTFNISLFYKDLDDYIVTTQVPLSKTSESTTPDINNLWLSNAESAYQWGAEISLNYLIHNSDWGINLQTTYNKGKVTYYDSNNGSALFKKNLPFLSKITASSMIFYDHPKFNFKLGAIFRDKYLVRAGSLLLDENETGFMPTVYWDANLNYYFSNHWKLKFSAFNLSNEQERQYSNSTLRAYNSTTSGRTYYLGLSYHY
ncbi:TonB-dependent receptor [Pseudoalteromonas sp. LC2018020214]|uniref:TonB-dependent receptor n=1 Tax=Pseudoalteromonas sp. LC2018020214 TaxID=2799564 RepID=UPI001906534E|nr:TonB-dependent receptor [Pseudoalteromonas sp. LC2018020214]QQM66083.1 TonB-dependent receptor [Pseudoalteromonas sp. LC2018020214]